MQQNVLENQLSREEQLALKNRRLGMNIFQLSWIMVFICLIVVNLQLRGSQESWPPPGVERMGVVLPTLATITLLISGFAARRGLQLIRQDAVQPFLSQWLVTIGLGILFVAMMIYEWMIVPQGSQYGSIFRVMIGFHGIHALVIGGYLWNIYQNGRKNVYGQFNTWAVEAGAKLWYFVVFAWILFYAVLYWI
jgi:cytochrome c oxidase subunit III